ncbi:MAG: riboflavin kinase, archaea type [Thermococcaceae archaeon]|nr:riboflavin kinase, archaea type [Thermococcaceae archaeon]
MKKLELLLSLGKRGAAFEGIRVTLRDLAKELGISPQSVMRLLNELEQDKLIKRHRDGKKTLVSITEDGLEFLERICDEISESVSRGLIVGEVVSGLGEGAYYVKQYAPLIREYLGFEPYPGTLNVRVIFPKTVFDAISDVSPVVLPGFVKDGRTFGDVKAYRIKLGDVEGAIVIPSRTVHPPKIAEIIAPVNLRETLGVKDGDRVRIRVLR